MKDPFPDVRCVFCGDTTIAWPVASIRYPLSCALNAFPFNLDSLVRPMKKLLFYFESADDSVNRSGVSFGCTQTVSR